MTHTLVSVIIPCYNEEKTITQLLNAILSQTYPQDQLEVIIADALSNDNTRKFIDEFQAENPGMKIKVVDNPKRIIPAGLNLAITSASGEIILRMDAHAVPAVDYIERCVTALNTGLGDNVGGVIDVSPGKENWIGRSIAVATAHPLGVGDALYRWTAKPTEADTVAFGSFKKTLIDKIGLFDESLLINEDYEFNTRVRAKGGKVWIDPAIRAVYYSRPDLHSLARQYFSYGFWKYRMLKRYPKTLRWRQALPPIFVFGILMLLLLFSIWNLARIGFAVAVGFYLAILVAGAIRPASQKKQIALIFGIPLAIITMHFSWGAGFWWSILYKGNLR